MTFVGKPSPTTEISKVLNTDENDIKESSVVPIYSGSIFFFQQRNRCGTKYLRRVALHNIMWYWERQDKACGTHSRLKEFI